VSKKPRREAGPSGRDLEAGPSGHNTPEIEPAITGVYCEKPGGYIQQEILPDHDVAFDPRCPYAVWAGQYLTRLPFIPDPNNPQKNILETVSFHFSRCCFLITL
jgi:hypothetical protein